ncbi:Trehalose utilization [Anatilimnocola aggregata]|uniref:Trehalose utilization n=1 Tax=Anatilimnocola aggregata TaxID=2528021 RepID=A0A517YIW2_9BACT|nr:ThuA domain-containing protein [Anatilimnocola aggregata]QDU30173.1 Trehalose utilization [Anatilimnocola aggregata]
MKRVLSLSVLLLLSLLTTLAVGEDKEAKKEPRTSGYRLLMITQSAGFRHGSVNRKDAKLAPAEQAITELGVKSNLFRADCSQDVAKDFTKENLKNYDIVLFYTTGNLPIKPEDLDYFFQDWLKQKGHGFIGTHSAADTYHNYQPYWDMIGGTFNGHPWGSGDTVTVSVHDTKHPVSKPWGEEFVIKDEIYRFKNWQPEKVRVLMSLNMAKTANKIDDQLRSQANNQEKMGKTEDAAKTRARIGEGPYHVPIAWVKNYGDGKAMHMSLGHNEAVWADERYMASLLNGIKWELNLEEGDATPNPEVSAEQEKKARADIAKAEKK